MSLIVTICDASVHGREASRDECGVWLGSRSAEPPGRCVRGGDEKGMRNLSCMALAKATGEDDTSSAHSSDTSTIPLIPKKNMPQNTTPMRMNQLGLTSGGSSVQFT